MISDKHRGREGNDRAERGVAVAKDGAVGAEVVGMDVGVDEAGVGVEAVVGIGSGGDAEERKEERLGGYPSPATELRVDVNETGEGVADVEEKDDETVDELVDDKFG